MTRGHRGSLLLRCRALSSPSPCRFIPAHPQFPPPPSERSTPHTPGGSSGPHFQALRPFHGLHPDFHGLGSSSSARRRVLTTRQASLHAADRSVAPPEGLSTLGFDPARLPAEPPACYRASWQLPGRDSHPLATTSFCWIRSTHQPPPTLAGRTKKNTEKKSHAMIPAACARRNSRQASPPRSLAGRRSDSRSSLRTVVAETEIPRPFSSPAIRW